MGKLWTVQGIKLCGGNVEKIVTGGIHKVSVSVYFNLRTKPCKH
jgi:hypothetical protein